MNNFLSKVQNLSSEDREHILLNAPKLIAKARDAQRFTDCLTNYGFIELKLRFAGAQAVVDDFDYLTAVELSLTKTKSKTVEALRLIQQSLRQVQDIVDADPLQLAGQLWGKLIDSSHSAHKRICREISENYQEKSWIKPINVPEFTKQQPLLLPIKADFSNEIGVAAMSGDGQWIIASESSGGTLYLWNLEEGGEPNSLSVYDPQFFESYLQSRDREESRANELIRIHKIGISHSGSKAVVVCNIGENTLPFVVALDCKSGDRTYNILLEGVTDEFSILPISENGIFLLPSASGVAKVVISEIEIRESISYEDDDGYKYETPLYEICLPQTSPESRGSLSAAISRDGQWVAVMLDPFLQIWNLKEGRIHEIVDYNEVKSLWFDDSNRINAITESDDILIWPRLKFDITYSDPQTFLPSINTLHHRCTGAGSLARIGSIDKYEELSLWYCYFSRWILRQKKAVTVLRYLGISALIQLLLKRAKGLFTRLLTNYYSERDDLGYGRISRSETLDIVDCSPAVFLLDKYRTYQPYYVESLRLSGLTSPTSISTDKTKGLTWSGNTIQIIDIKQASYTKVQYKDSDSDGTDGSVILALDTKEGWTVVSEDGNVVARKSLSNNEETYIPLTKLSEADRFRFQDILCVATSVDESSIYIVGNDGSYICCKEQNVDLLKSEVFSRIKFVSQNRNFLLEQLPSRTLRLRSLKDASSHKLISGFYGVIEHGQIFSNENTVSDYTSSESDYLSPLGKPEARLKGIGTAIACVTHDAKYVVLYSVNPQVDYLWLYSKCEYSFPKGMNPILIYDVEADSTCFYQLPNKDLKPRFFIESCVDEHVLVCCGGSTLYWFNPKQGTIDREVLIDGKIISVALSVNDRWLVVSTGDRNIEIWNLSSTSLTRTFSLRAILYSVGIVDFSSERFRVIGIDAQSQLYELEVHLQEEGRPVEDTPQTFLSSIGKRLPQFEDYSLLLRPESSIDYSELKKLLEAADWSNRQDIEEADQKTSDIINYIAERLLKVLDANGYQSSIGEAVKAFFPKSDLTIIDTLWTKYSHGNQGISAHLKVKNNLQHTKSIAELHRLTGHYSPSEGIDVNPETFEFLPGHFPTVFVSKEESSLQNALNVRALEAFKSNKSVDTASYEQNIYDVTFENRNAGKLYALGTFRSLLQFEFPRLLVGFIDVPIKIEVTVKNVKVLTVTSDHLQRIEFDDKGIHKCVIDIHMDSSFILGPSLGKKRLYDECIPVFIKTTPYEKKEGYGRFVDDPESTLNFVIMAIQPEDIQEYVECHLFCNISPYGHLLKLRRFLRWLLVNFSIGHYYVQIILDEMIEVCKSLNEHELVELYNNEKEIYAKFSEPLSLADLENESGCQISIPEVFSSILLSYLSSSNKAIATKSPRILKKFAEVCQTID